jgi:DNA-binding transcriptional regulator PaaX
MSRVSEQVSWLVLAYRVPGEAARLRVPVRRRLTTAGAVYLANSVAALPATPAAERLLRRLGSDISRAGGSAQLLRAGPLAGGADLVRLYNAARDDEHAQLIAGCDRARRKR